MALVVRNHRRVARFSPYRIARFAARHYSNWRREGPQYPQSGIDRKLGVGFNNPPAKRQRIEGTMAGFSAGATNVIQRKVINRKSGRKLRKHGLKYLAKLSKATTSNQILRFQGMTPYDDNGYYACGYSKAADLSAKYPVYLFDITSCNTATSALIPGFPFYRLVSDAAGDFGWEGQVGQTADGLVTAQNWFIERRPIFSGTIGYSMGSTSLLDWSDIRLALYGATSQTTRWTVSFVQFVNEVDHPRAARANPAAANPLSDQTQQGRFNAAMEEIVKPLVFHPLHVAGNATNVFKFMDTRTFNIQPGTTTNEAKAAPNVLYKNFKRMGRICKWNWNTQDQDGGGNKLQPELAAGLDSNAAVNVWSGSETQPYVHPNARIYMLVTAQAYIRTGQGPSGEPVAVNIENTPSFDLSVRNKWCFDQV